MLSAFLLPRIEEKKRQLLCWSARYLIVREIITMRSELEKIRREIDVHPGYKAHVRWGSLWRTHAVLTANYQEFRRHLDRPSNDQDLFMELIQNVRLPSQVQDAFHAEVDRLLHNFVASAATLVDHTRRLVDHYGGTAFAKEYQSRKTSLVTLAEAAFIKDLRNYVLHYGIPAIVGTYTFNTKGFSAKFELDVDVLTKWDGWKQLSREYLKQAADTVVLTEPLDEYARALDALYQWMAPRFRELHGNEIVEVDRLIDHFNDVLSGKVSDTDG